MTNPAAVTVSAKALAHALRATARTSIVALAFIVVVTTAASARQCTGREPIDANMTTIAKALALVPHGAGAKATVVATVTAQFRSFRADFAMITMIAKVIGDVKMAPAQASLIVVICANLMTLSYVVRKTRNVEGIVHVIYRLVLVPATAIVLVMSAKLKRNGTRWALVDAARTLSAEALALVPHGVGAKAKIDADSSKVPRSHNKAFLVP